MGTYFNPSNEGFQKSSQDEIYIDKTTAFNHANIVIRGNNNKFYIGENTITNNAQFHLYGDNKTMRIGKNCLFSYNVEIWSGDGHAIYKIGEDKPYNIGKDMTIGDGVWIGAYAKLLKGANIAAGSIVSMNSLVNKTFDMPNVIVAGNPAKVVRENIRWEGRSPEEAIR